MITSLALEGHDAELFSFIDDHFRDPISDHPCANTPLWTFGRTGDGVLNSVCQWNGSPGCFAFFSKPDAKPDEDGWINWHGFVTEESIICVSALTFVRYEFAQFYSPVALDGVLWIRDHADRTLERLAYIRGYGGRKKSDLRWQELRYECAAWASRALDQLENILMMRPAVN